MPQYAAVYQLIHGMQQRLGHDQHLCEMFARCLLNTLDTTVTLLDDGTTFVLTGDIPAMWLRDSSAQVSPYVGIAKQDADLQRLLRGLVERQARYVLVDPYANAFNCEASGQGHSGDRPAPGPWVWERKYELDSLCYPLSLAYRYWKATGDDTVWSETVHQALGKIVEVMRVERSTMSALPIPSSGLIPGCPPIRCPLGGRARGRTSLVWSGRGSDRAMTPVGLAI